MGEIIPIVSQQAAEDAWAAYEAHVAPAIENPRLIAERGWVEQSIRLHNRFAHIFTRLDDER